jgi:hypothetical protein
MDNRGFLDILNVGCNDLNWGGTPNCSPIGEQEMMQTQDVSASAKPRSTRAPSAKGKNWSSAEDKVLIEAWGNTSLDAVTGTDQNSHSYWGRIADYYKAHKQPSWPERNANALNCRFTGISSSTSKFCGCVQQILNKEESGRTIDEKVCIVCSNSLIMFCMWCESCNNTFFCSKMMHTLCTRNWILKRSHLH